MSPISTHGIPWGTHSMCAFPQLFRAGCRAFLILGVVCGFVWGMGSRQAEAALRAGGAKVDITDYDAGPVSDPSFVRVLILEQADQRVVLVSVDAVAIGEIGRISNAFLPRLRAELRDKLGILPEQIIINASHCHSIIRPDPVEQTVAAVQEALSALEPAQAGVGRGFEDRIMENRRVTLKNGREADVRHAYAFPPDEAVAAVGPVDPEIGLLRVDRLDGSPVAVLYNFACHPIQGMPNGGNTADMTGFASQVVEDTLGSKAVAIFFQGCGGDINPVRYKDIANPRDAETLGNLLGLSVLKGWRTIPCRPDTPVKLVTRTLALPRADNAERIEALEAEQQRLLRSIKGTTLNLKSFLRLMASHGISEQFPSYDAYRYLHEESRSRKDLERLDAENRRNVQNYLDNIYTMEELSRLQANLALLKRHQARNVAAGSRTLDVELTAVRVGDFVLTTFPGELTVRIGLGIKKASPHPFTFVAGYTNGYIYYAPTAEQLRNVGGAQEDSDCLVAPEWQAVYEAAVAELLRGI